MWIVRRMWQLSTTKLTVGFHWSCCSMRPCAIPTTNHLRKGKVIMYNFLYCTHCCSEISFTLTQLFAKISTVTESIISGVLAIVDLPDWLIDFNGMSTHFELFYVWKWGSYVHYTFIFTYLVLLFIKKLIFCIWLCDIKYFYLIQIIYMQLYDFR